MDYEPLDGSVVSIDTTLNDGFVADDLNVSRRPSLYIEMKPHSYGVDNENEPISTSIPKKPTKTQQQLACKKPGARIKLAFRKSQRHAKAQMDFQLSNGLSTTSVLRTEHKLIQIILLTDSFPTNIVL